MVRQSLLNKQGRGFAIVAGLMVVAAGGLAAATYAASATRHLPYQREFCFAEWCVTPTSYGSGNGTEQVGMHVRSDAGVASQRPDHPQAWLVQESGSKAGGPQAGLDRRVGPGESYDVTLVFHVSGSDPCPNLLMSEGAWPPFLGLGDAPSPFTERVDWPLCGP